MDTSKKIIKYIAIIANIGLSVFFAGSYYYFVGLIMGMLCILSFIFKDTVVGDLIIKSQIHNYNRFLLGDEKEDKLILLTIAFLVLSMKVGAIIALVVEGLVILIVAFCILLAFGWFFDGVQSGVSPGIAYAISRIIVKIYLFLNSAVSKIAEWIVKLEFSILGIEYE